MSQELQAITQLDSLVTDEVGQNEGRTSTLTLDRVDQNLATAAEGLIDESVCDPEVLFCVLLRLIVQLQVEVLEEAVTLRVRLASHVQNVSDASLDQLTSLERTLERSHVNALVNLEQADVPDRLLAVNIASAEVNVREATADDLLFLASVRLTVIIVTVAGLLLVDGSAAEPRVPLDLP